VSTASFGAEANLRWFFEDASSLARIGRQGEAYVFEWPEFLRITIRGAEVTIEPSAEFPTRLLSKVRKGAAPALVRYVSGGVAFHGACVSMDDAALLFVGTSGAGKSTTAAMMCARAGARLLADDAVAGTFDGRTLVIDPLEDEHWLTRDSIEALGAAVSPDEEKAPVRTEPAISPAIVKAIIALEVGEETNAIERLHGRAAVETILRAMVRLPLDQERMLRDFDVMLAIAKHIPVLRVLRPATFSATLEENFVACLRNLLEDRHAQPR